MIIIEENFLSKRLILFSKISECFGKTKRYAVNHTSTLWLNNKFILTLFILIVINNILIKTQLDSLGLIRYSDIFLTIYNNCSIYIKSENFSKK